MDIYVLRMNCQINTHATHSHKQNINININKNAKILECFYFNSFGVKKRRKFTDTNLIF